MGVTWSDRNFMSFCLFAPDGSRLLFLTTVCSRLVTAPISLHWLWSPEDNRFGQTTFSQQERDLRTEFVSQKSMEMCHDW